MAPSELKKKRDFIEIRDKVSWEEDKKIRTILNKEFPEAPRERTYDHRIAVGKSHTDSHTAPEIPPKLTVY